MSSSTDFESIVRSIDPRHDDLYAGGFRDYRFGGGRIGKKAGHEPWDMAAMHLPPQCGEDWDDSKTWNDNLNWCDGDSNARHGIDIDWIAENWPGTRDGCYVDEDGYLKPEAICGGAPTAFCPDIVPEFTFTSLVIDGGKIVSGIVENEITVDGESLQLWRWHTVQPNLDGLPWRSLLPGQVITARYVQYKIHVSTR